MKFLTKFLWGFLFSLSIFSYFFPNRCQAQYLPVDQLPHITSIPDFQPGDGILFTTQNIEKIKIIQDMVADYDLKQGVFHDKETKSTFRYIKTQKSFQIPIIEFRRINPTKYRIRVHGAHENFPFIFSERFHHNWKLYLVPLNFQQLNLNDQDNQQLLSSYKVFEGNEKTQTSPKKLKNFISNGWITDIEKDSPSKLNPYYLLKALFRSHAELENKMTAFISKKFANAIQNDNLPTNIFRETWFAGKIRTNCNKKKIINNECEWSNPESWETKTARNPNVFEWPDQLHWQANSLVNSWWINLDIFPNLFSDNNQKTVFYRSNADGSIDFELVMEFWPQRLFYGGGILSLSVVSICLIALFVRWIQQKNKQNLSHRNPTN